MKAFPLATRKWGFFFRQNGERKEMVVQAATRSEARARVKAKYGRLPKVGINLQITELVA